MTELLIISLTVWRICILLHMEVGPFDIFDNFRTAIGLTKFESATMQEQVDIVNKLEYEPIFINKRDTFLANVVECMWCLSIYIAGLATLYAALIGIITWQLVPFYICASSAICIMIETWRENYGISNT